MIIRKQKTPDVTGLAQYAVFTNSGQYRGQVYKLDRYIWAALTTNTPVQHYRHSIVGFASQSAAIDYIKEHHTKTAKPTQEV